MMKRYMVMIFSFLVASIIILGNSKQSVLATSESLSDVVVQLIEFDPPHPNPGDPVNIKVTVKNIGSSAVSGIRLYLFVNPVDQPPVEGTPYTSQFFYGTSLPAGGEFIYTRTGHVFSADGVYPIYAWADPQNLIAEEDDFNNLSSQRITVGTGDSGNFEPDDSCTQAQLIPTDGSQHMRELELTTDVDWFKFNVTAGSRYQVVVTPDDPDAEITADFHESCTARSGAEGKFIARSTGTYYVRVYLNRDGYGIGRTYRILVNNYGTATETPTFTPSPTIIPTITPSPTPSPTPPSSGCPVIASRTVRYAPRLPFVTFLPIVTQPGTGSRSARDILFDPVLEPNIIGFGYDRVIADILPLDGVDTLFKIQLKQGEIPLPESIEVFAEETPTLMRDDGCAPDATANDGIYTVRVTLSQEEFDLVQLAPNPANRSQDRINTGQELFVTATSVVNDPARTRDLCGPTNNPLTGAVGNGDGAWSFKTLMMNLAETTDEGVAADFAEQWLRTWLTDQTVIDPLSGSSDVIEARGSMESLILTNWLTENGKLDLDFAPFRLLAIVTRLDLRNHPAVHLVAPNPNDVSAGELRFVFGVLDPATCSPLQFTTIFEYGLRANSMRDVKNFATQIHALGSLPAGSEIYKAALQTLTDGVVLNNSINQIRTNEIALAFPWELREFELNRTIGQLQPTTVKLTPDSNRNGTGDISAFINANISQLLFIDPFTNEPNPRHNFPTAAGNSLADGTIWDATGIINSEARFQFGLNTCNGCHETETATAFLHVRPRFFNSPTLLSGFLTGSVVNDPITGEQHQFDDLARRERDLNFILNATPYELVIFDGLNSREH